ncbi:MAG: hypothetical protein ACOY0T_19515 [Myxococcota bacterium]
MSRVRPRRAGTPANGARALGADAVPGREKGDVVSPGIRGAAASPSQVVSPEPGYDELIAIRPFEAPAGTNAVVPYDRIDEMFIDYLVEEALRSWRAKNL